jgi:hypothetical protein
MPREEILRNAIVLMLGLLAIAGAPSPTQAAPGSVLRTEIVPSPNIVEVDRRCGRHAHWVPGHRNRYGRWVRGHCRPNH